MYNSHYIINISELDYLDIERFYIDETETDT